MQKRIVVGAVKVNKPFEYRKNNYECAAWWEMHQACVGVHPLYLQSNYHSPHELYLTADISAKVVDDYFPGLWCGVAISNKPYEPKHIGEDRTIHHRIEIEEAIQRTGNSPNQDIDVFFHPDWWAMVKAEATTKLEESYRRLPEFWSEYQTLNSETFTPKLDGHYTFRMDTDAKIGMVGYFGEQLSKWARRLQIISRHEGYRSEPSLVYMRNLYLTNTDWAKAIDVQPFDKALLSKAA